MIKTLLLKWVFVSANFAGVVLILRQSTPQRLVAKFDTISQHQYVQRTSDQQITSPRFLKVCRRTRGRNFLVTHKNLAFRFNLASFASGIGPIPVRDATDPAAQSWLTELRLRSVWKTTPIFSEKWSLAVRSLFGWMAMLRYIIPGDAANPNR